MSKNLRNNLPAEAVVFFPDGNMLCAVNGDFENLQESSAGFGKDVIEALVALRAEQFEEEKKVRQKIVRTDDMIDSVYKSQGLTDFDIMLKRNSRHVAEWPEWKQNVLVNNGKSTLDEPRAPVDNNNDDYSDYDH